MYIFMFRSIHAQYSQAHITAGYKHQTAFVVSTRGPDPRIEPTGWEKWAT